MKSSLYARPIFWLACIALGVSSLSAQTLLVSIDFDDRSLLDRVSGTSNYDTGLFTDGPIYFNEEISSNGYGLDVDYLRYLRIPLDVAAGSGGQFTVKYDYYHRETAFDGSTTWHAHSFAVRDETNGYGWSQGFRNIGNDYWSSEIVGFAAVGAQVKGDPAEIPNFSKYVWREYVLVFNETQLDWYVDGVFAYSQTFDTSFADWDWSASDITIGARFQTGSITELAGVDYYRGTGGGNTSSRSLSGVFDNVRIWGGAFDAAAIATGVETLIVPEPYVSLSEKASQVSSEANSFDVNIDSNTDWSFDGGPAWISVAPLSGNGSGVVTVSVEANIDGLARRADYSVGGASFAVLQSALPESVDTDAMIHIETGNQLIDNVFFDLKSPNMANVDQAMVNDLFIVDGFNGFRFPIFGTRDRPNKANGVPAHPSAGVVDGTYYAQHLNIAQMALAVNPDLVVFASKKLNGPYSFPEWCLNETLDEVLPDQYAILLADYIEYMDGEGVPTHVLGIDNERFFNEGGMMPELYGEVVDALKALSVSRGFTMPVIIGYEDYYPGRDDWMRILVENGLLDRMDLYGTHYYPEDREAERIEDLESDLAYAGEVDRWHSELHWNTKNQIDDILEIEDGAGSLFDMTDRGFTGLMWWDYKRTGLRGSIMRELTSNLLGYRPIAMTDHDGVEIITDGKLHTRAFQKGSEVVVWAMNMSATNTYDDYTFGLSNGHLTGAVNATQWSEANPEGVAVVLDLCEGNRFRVSMGSQTVTMIQFALVSETPILEESWDVATAATLSGTGTIQADNLWNYEMNNVSYAVLQEESLPLSGKAIFFDAEDLVDAVGYVETALPVTLDPEALDSISLKVKGVLSFAVEVPEGETRVGVVSSDGQDAYEVVFSSNRLDDPTLQIRIKSNAYGTQTIDIGHLSDQVENVLYDVTASFEKVAVNQTQVHYAVHRNRMFWKEGSAFMDTAISDTILLEQVNVGSSQFSNMAIDEIAVYGSEPTSGEPINFNYRIRGVEQRAVSGGQAVADLTYGVPFSDIAQKMTAMGVNCITIPITEDGNHEPTIAYIQQIRSEFGRDVDVVLSSRRWYVTAVNKREDWAQEMGDCYNAINKAGLACMVTGFRIADTDPLDGTASTALQWKTRFNNIEDMAHRLNIKTGGSLKTRSLIIHGEGYGGNFKGVVTGSFDADFDADIALEAGNYAFSVRMSDTGSPANADDSTIAEWETHFKEHCGLDELALLARPVIFVGNADQGLAPRSLDTTYNPSPAWPNQPRALGNVFDEKGFQHFCFGPFLADSGSSNETVLHTSIGNALSENTDQINDWNQWKTNTERSNGAPIGSTIWLRALGNDLVVAADSSVTESPLGAIDSSAVSNDARFVVRDAGDGYIRLESVGNGLNVRADWGEGTDRPLMANTSGTGSWTKFSWNALNDNTMVRIAWIDSSLNVRSDLGTSNNALEADSNGTGSWTKFLWGILE